MSDEKLVSPEDIENTKLESEEFDDMPEPRVKKYQKVCVLSEKFKELLNKTLGSLGYNQVIGVPQQHFQINQLFKRLEELKYRVEVNEMNRIIGLIALCPYNVIKPMMDVIENPATQKVLWSIEEE